MAIGVRQAFGQASTGNSQSVVSSVIGETGDFLVNKEGAWFRRAMPLVLRFAFNQPVLGSVFGIVNIYIGLGNSIVQAHRAVRKAGKYWGFVHGAQWAAVQLSPNQTCTRFRLLPDQAFLAIRGTTKFTNQKKGAIEVNSQTYDGEFRAGICDAIDCYNKLFAGIEKATAQQLMQMVANGASQTDRQKAYNEAVSRLRYVGGMGLYKELTANLPPQHIKEMLGY